LIDYILIGAQRCGTTSLYNNLILHPQIEPAAQKEVHFFDINFQKGVDWYLEQFPSISDSDQKKERITGEASPYYIFHPLAPKRISDICPKVKLILILRNPVDRTYSHYQHEIRLGYESLTFEEALEAEPKKLKGQEDIILNGGYSLAHQHFSYLARGIYVDQLKFWHKFFGKEQFLILKSEDFFSNHKKTLNKVFDFLEIPHFEIHEFKIFQPPKFPEMKGDTKKFLINYFKPHNEKLYEYLGRDFEW